MLGTGLQLLNCPALAFLLVRHLGLRKLALYPGEPIHHALLLATRHMGAQRICRSWSKVRELGIPSRHRLGQYHRRGPPVGIVRIPRLHFITDDDLGRHWGCVSSMVEILLTFVLFALNLLGQLVHRFILIL